jgi:hypothetical protein
MKKNKKIIDLHRYIGLIICIFLVLLSITGIFLNHTEDLKLSQRHLKWPWLMKIYGFEVPKVEQHFEVGDHFISNYQGQIFIDGQSSFVIQDALKGVVINNHIFYIATSEAVYLFSDQQDFIDILEPPVDSIQSIGQDQLTNTILIQDNVRQIWSLNDIENDWQLTEIQSNPWSIETSMTSMQQEMMKNYFFGKGISLEQFLLDIHNGAILKKLGKYLLDIVGILTLVLSITGIWMWSFRKKR